MTMTKKVHAGIYSPVMEAVLGEMFSFAEIKEAVMRLDHIRRTFVIAKEQPQDDQVLMWIKDYAITEEEKKEGYRGNFAVVSIAPLGENRFTLKAEKQTLPLNQHPQKKRAPMSVPDWGHPLLRAIQKGYIYSTLEEAQKHLQNMHEQFPKVSIPGNNRLFTMIYRRPLDGKGPSVKKWILLIKAAQAGGFQIEVKENQKPEKAPEKQKVGKFTAQVEIRKKPTKKP
jgi:hypothetical protein